MASVSSPAAEDRGIFIGNGETLEEVVKSGDPAPLGMFCCLADPSISGDMVAFRGSDGKAGIFTINFAGSLTTIMRFEDAAPFGTFFDTGEPAISGNEVAFYASYGELTDDGIFSKVGAAVFVGSGGPLTPVITIGDTLFGSTVIEIGLGRFGFDPEGGGNVAFSYLLADGRQGIAIAAIVPEPTGLHSLCIAMLALGLMDRKWSKASRQCKY